MSFFIALSVLIFYFATKPDYGVMTQSAKTASMDCSVYKDLGKKAQDASMLSDRFASLDLDDSLVHCHPNILASQESIRDLRSVSQEISQRITDRYPKTRQWRIHAFSKDADMGNKLTFAIKNELIKSRDVLDQSLILQSAIPITSFSAAKQVCQDQREYVSDTSSAYVFWDLYLEKTLQMGVCHREHWEWL